MKNCQEESQSSEQKPISFPVYLWPLPRGLRSASQPGIHSSESAPMAQPTAAPTDLKTVETTAAVYRKRVRQTKAAASLSDGQLDLMMLEFSNDSSNIELRNDLLIALLNKAAQGAALAARTISNPPASLATDLQDGELIHGIALEIVDKTIEGLIAGKELTGGYVYCAAQSAVRDALKLARIQQRIQREVALSAPYQDAQDLAYGTVEQERVRSAVAELPSKLKQVIGLHMLDGMTLRDVAARLGQGLATTFEQKEKGLALLRVALG